MSEVTNNPGTISFFSRGVSHWQFENSDGAGGLKLLDVAYESGTLALRSPSGGRFAFAYRGVGVADGLEIHLPMRIPHSRLLGIKIAGLTKVIRKKINKVAEVIGIGSDIGGRYAAETASDELPDPIHPARGAIFLGPGCSEQDLSPQDFEGWCVFCNVDAGAGFGVSGTGMLVGLGVVRHSWLRHHIVDVSRIASLFEAVEVVAQAKALVFFAGANFNFRLGGGASAVIGYVSRSNDRPSPPGDILQLQMEILQPTPTADGREIS